MLALDIQLRGNALFLCRKKIGQVTNSIYTKLPSGSNSYMTHPIAPERASLSPMPLESIAPEDASLSSMPLESQRGESVYIGSNRSTHRVSPRSFILGGSSWITWS